MKIPLEQILEAVSADEYRGFCLTCGADADGIEPDARKYQCRACGQFALYGAEEILMMGETKD